MTPQTSSSVEQRVAAWVRRHPAATAEEVSAYRVTAEANQQEAKYAWDGCFSPPKSWSVLEATWRWDGRDRDAETLWECLEAGAEAALSHLFGTLAFIQSRPTGTELGGTRAARYEPAANLQMAMFRHHVSREGDPQLHLHTTIFNRVLNGDGRWRALYSPAMFRAKHEMDAVFLRVAEAEATRRLGLRFASTPAKETSDDRHAAPPSREAREIVGVPEAARRFFSSRDRALSERAQELLDEFHAANDRPATARERWRIRQKATLSTRTGKPADPPSAAQRIAQWEEAFSRDTRETFASVRDGVDEVRAVEAVVAPVVDRDAVIAQALDDVGVGHSAWSVSKLVDALNRRLPDMLAVEPAAVPGWLLDLARDALASPQVVPVHAPPKVPAPASMQDPKSGRNVFDAPDYRKFTTRETLGRENALVSRLDELGAPWVPPATAAALLEGAGLSDEQAGLLRAVLSSPRRLELVDAAPGTGKSTTARALSRACEAQWGVGVTGFTVAENPAKVLRHQGITRAHNIAAFLDYRRRERLGEVSEQERVTFSVAAGSYVLVDEASTVDTTRLVELIGELEEVGVGKVLLVGDREQADPVDAGGAFGMLVDELEQRRGQRNAGTVHRLRMVRRFDRQWERDASAQLRDGDVTALHQYDTRGRLHGHTERDDVRDAAVAGCVTDILAGRASIVVASTSEEASAAADRVRQRLVEAGHVEEGSVDLRDGARAGLGDLVQTRLNDRRVGVLNRQCWQVVSRADDGSLEVREDLGQGDAGPRWGPVVALPAEYVRAQLELAYAATVHAVEGTTIRGASHTVVGRATGRSHALVGLTRATVANHAYCELAAPAALGGARAKVTALEHRQREAVTAQAQESVSSALEQARATVVDLERQVETPLGRLAVVMGRDDHEPAARVAMAVEQDRVVNLGRLGPEWEFLVRETRAATHRRLLVDVLGPDDGWAVLSDPAVRRLYGLLRGAELSGHEPAELLAQCAGPLEGARSAASAIYYRVAKQMAVGPLPRPVPLGFEARTPRPSLGEVENERLTYARELGKVMDRRAGELAERATVEQPVWAVRALGAVPDLDADPDGYWRWRGNVALACAYRERYGIDDQHTALGRRPAHADPERGWLWDTAAGRLGVPEHDRSLAALPDVELADRERQWQLALVWMPANVDEQLRDGWAAVAEAERQVTADRVAGRDTAASGALLEEMRVFVEKAERVAEVRAAAYERTTPIRERAVEARAERERREDVERERLHALHRDDPGPDEPQVDPEFDEPDVEPEPLAVEAAVAEAPVWDEADTRAAVFGWATRHGHVDADVVFGSRAWCELDDADPAKAAAVSAAALRVWNLGEGVDVDALRRRAVVADVEEPEQRADPALVLGAQFWAEDHDLHAGGPRYGSELWAQLPDDDPGKRGAEAAAALSWLGDGDTLDDLQARVERAEEQVRAAAPAVEVDADPNVAALDERAVELETAAERGGFTRPTADVEVEEPGVEPEPTVDRSRYQWVRDAQAAVTDPEPETEVEPEPEPQRWTVVSADPDPEFEPAPEPEPEPDPEEEYRATRARMWADIDAEVERAAAARERMDAQDREAAAEAERAREEELERGRELEVERQAEAQAPQVEVDA